LYWDDKRNEAEFEALRLIDESEDLVAVNPKEDAVFSQITELVTIENIRSGNTQQLLKQYVGKLNPSQKKVFLEELEFLLTHSVEIELLFGAVDVQYFIDQIRSQSLPGTKADFVNSLADKTIPDFWPTTQKAMLMIASLY
jgi:hypothetical protein